MDSFDLDKGSKYPYNQQPLTPGQSFNQNLSYMKAESNRHSTEVLENNLQQLSLEIGKFESKIRKLGVIMVNISALFQSLEQELSKYVDHITKLENEYQLQLQEQKKSI